MRGSVSDRDVGRRPPRLCRPKLGAPAVRQHGPHPHCWTLPGLWRLHRAHWSAEFCIRGNEGFAEDAKRPRAPKKAPSHVRECGRSGRLPCVPGKRGCKALLAANDGSVAPPAREARVFRSSPSRFNRTSRLTQCPHPENTSDSTQRIALMTVVPQGATPQELLGADIDRRATDSLERIRRQQAASTSQVGARPSAESRTATSPDLLLSASGGADASPRNPPTAACCIHGPAGFACLVPAQAPPLLQHEMNTCIRCGLFGSRPISSLERPCPTISPYLPRS